MAAAAGAAAWKITGEDRAKHDSQFFQLKPVNGFITGEQARGFFLQSGLPTAVLGQIWQLADMNSDGKMDKKEFSIAMHLIKKKLQGFELPKTLPPSLKADPSPSMGSFGAISTAGQPVMGMGMPAMGMASTVVAPSSMGVPIMTNGVPMMGVPPSVGVPGAILANKSRAGSFGQPAPAPAPAAGNMALPHPSKLKYTQMFNSHDRNKRGHLTGVEARSLLVQSGLPQPMLAQIWTLADYDKDGKLTCDEFCVAMHLADLARNGIHLPAVLPPELVPVKSRSGSFSAPVPMPPTSQAPAKGNAFGDLLGGMGMLPPQPAPPAAATNGEDQLQDDDKLGFTFEDRRKQNFDKGQAELERRRQMLQDQMKRENEARMEKERQEQEKREKIRQEQERRRLAEMERQMEKQRQIEREREEQRQKMMEQREAARRELERQRQMDWERQRKEQLLSEKAREYEQLGIMKSRASNLKCELESQQGKKAEIRQKIEQVRNGVTDFTNSIEGMRITRDSKNSAMDKLQTDIKEFSDKLVQLQSERESLNYRVQTSVQNNPLTDAHRTVLHGVELKKTSLQKLRKELENIERETESKLLEIDKHNAELEEMKKTLSSAEDKMKKQQQQKHEASLQLKRKQEEEDRARAQQEKEKQEKLRKELAAQRLKEEEEEKAKSTSSNDAWAAFSNDTQSTAASNDIWSAAFADIKTDTSQASSDIWDSAFSSQTTTGQTLSTLVTSSSSKGCRYKALYPFEARNQDELSLTPEDIVWVPEDQTGAEEGWIGGEMNGKKGWFPRDYVEKLPDTQSSQFNAFGNAFSSEPVASAFPQKESLYSTPAESPTPGQGSTAPEGLQAQALYPWKAKKENHLSFNKGDIIQIKEQQEMWWSGELQGQVGWFPKSYVKLVSGPVSKQTSRSGTPMGTSAAPVVPVETNDKSTPTIVEHTAEAEPFVAMFTYTSSEAGDLTFNQGETILVTKKEGDWWTGSLGERSGIFPANYVKATEQQQAVERASDTLDSVNSEQGLSAPNGFTPVSQSDSDLLQSTPTQNMITTVPPPSPSHFPTPSVPNENVLSASIQNTQPPICPLRGSKSQEKKLKKSVTFEDTVIGGAPSPSESAMTGDKESDKDVFGFDASPFGEDPFSSESFSADPFSSDKPFSSDSPLSEDKDPFKSTEFSSSDDFANAFLQFNVGVSTQTEIDNTGTTQNSTVFSLAAADDGNADLFSFSSEDTGQVMLRKKDNENPELRDSSSVLELSKYFPDVENEAQEGVENEAPEGNKKKKKDSGLFSDFGNLNAGASEKNADNAWLSDIGNSDGPSKNSEATGTVNQGSKDELQNNFAFLQNLSAADNSYVESTPVVNRPLPAELITDISPSSSDQVSRDKLDSNFAFQNLSVRKDFPKLEDIKLHSANSSIGDYDDCSFMRTSIDEGDSLEGGSLSGRSADPALPTAGGGTPDTVDDYDDLSGIIMNLKSLQENSATGQDEVYDDLDFIATPVKVEKGLNSDYVDEAREEDYDDIPFFTERKEVEERKIEETEQREDEYDDFLSIIKTTDGDKAGNQSREITRDDLYIDIVEYDKFNKSSEVQKEATGEVFENFNFIQSLSKNAPVTKQNISVLTAHQSESLEDDTYEPIEQFRSMLTESSQVAGQAQPTFSPTPAVQPTIQAPQSATSQPAQQKSGTSSTLKKPEIASVIAAYTATGAEQLSLNPGQLIQVRKKSPSGWWEGELQARGQRKKIGWFPANYVKILGGSSARSTPDSTSQSGSPANTLHRTATPTIPAPQPQKSAIVESKYVDQVIALYPYTAQNDDELTFHKDSVINVINKEDANWWQGELNGTLGMFPANYVGSLTSSPPQENTWSSDPAVLAQTSSVESKRQNYIHELINTEETYMADMSIVLDAFHEPMESAGVMTHEELETIFVNWKELILCNTKLLKSVRVRKKMCGKGQVIQIIGDVLCENIPHMTPYIRFCSCQLNAAALIQRYTENSSEFREIQKKCVQDPKTKGMPLSSFLLKPMQRITKYPLMIQKILQYTPENHPDRQNLEDALSKAEELCSQVNEGVRERENSDKLEWMQNHVQCEGLQEKLIFNSVTNCLGPRKLLYHGTLYKAKGHKELFTFLFNDFLLLATPLSSATSSFLFDFKTKAQYKMYKSPIFLNEVMVRRLGEDDGECLLQVSHVDRVYNLKAPNLTERESWVRHIDAASKLFLDTEKKKREKLFNLGQKSHMVGRLLVIIQEGINLSPTADVRKINGVGRLLVVLLEGCDLQASDANGKSDPYCEVSMGVQEHKTKVINATLNPRWNASMQFTIKDLEQDVLCITVFDRDLFSPNDFLGRTEVRVNEILEESKTRKGPITKRLLLHEVSSGEVVVKLDLQLYDNS